MQTVQHEKQLFKIPEVEEFLGISRAQVYRLIESGQIRRIKIGKSARVPRASLVAYVEHLEEQDSDDQ
jgi:excisionase family DNA binding protein